MTENAHSAASVRDRVLRAWPWLVVASEAVAVTGIALLFTANELRVALSYHPQNPARDARLAAYETFGETTGAILRWTLAAMIPLLLGQCLAWAWIRKAAADRPRLGWIMPVTTLLGLALLAFFGFLSAIAISASMVG